MTNNALNPGGTDRIGVDLVSIPRLTRLLADETFLERVLSPDERTRTDPAFVAGRLAAKEAICKALGVSPPRWRDVEILGDGRPTVRLAPDLQAHVSACDVSITHDGDVAVAVALVRPRSP